jgi:hypothetical protein
MVLDYAVNETAKEIAASVYPIAFINEIEDEKIGESGSTDIPTSEVELEKLTEQFYKSSNAGILNLALAEDYKKAETSGTLKGILEDYGKGAVQSMIDVMAPAYWNMKSAGK